MLGFSWTIISISVGDFTLISELVLSPSFVGFTQSCLLTMSNNLMTHLNYMSNEQSM